MENEALHSSGGSATDRDDASLRSQLRRKATNASSGPKGLTLSRVFTALSLRKPETESAEDTHGPHGLNLLFDSSEPLADLVFVHGLGGGSRKTWDKNRNPQLYWPKEWLSRDPDFKHVRVHSFGYDADWVQRQESILNIHDFANSLLAHLQASSTIRRSKNVPLIFVCHSMGGLVVKKAFILAQHDVSFQDLGKRFDTIYFLATPHHGAGSAQLLSALIRLTHAGNRPFISDLKQDSPTIQAINDEFRHYSSQVQLYSFFETKATVISGLGERFIVTKASAAMQLPNERITPLRADHPGVCKYLTPTDPNYILVRDAIVEALDRITDAWSSANGETIKLEKQRLRTFLRIPESLQLSEVDFDEPRVQGSCEWLLLEPTFRSWCDAMANQVFWLYGNPGTGKTFITRYVASHIKNLGFDCSSFYFSVGDKSRSSITGCLLSLAWQMAENNPLIRTQVLELYERNGYFNPESFQSIWRTLFVGGIFQTNPKKPQFWVLDGLDECTDYNELFPLLARIRTSFPLQIFISSQPNPDSQGSFVSHGLKAEMYQLKPEKTANDIKLYIENHVDFPNFRGGLETRQLISSMHRKSEGSFMWVRLVLKELRGALSEEATKRVLQQTPKGMDQQYLRSLEPLSQEKGRLPTARAILMWASTSIRPLSTTELKYALIMHVNETFNRLEDDISWLCGYLVIVDAHGRVKMVHETARRFIFNSTFGLAVNFREVEAHERLAIVCLRYLNSGELKVPRGRKAAMSQDTHPPRSPLFSYAAMSFHEHIQRSKSTSEELIDLVHSFLSATGGNVLSWIDFVASSNKGMVTMVQAGTALRSFALRAGRDRKRQMDKLDLIQSWSTDLLRIAAKFGRNLERFPASIYSIIPQFCPKKSTIHRQFGHSNRSISVSGVPSLNEWDDCLATIAYKKQPRGNRTVSVAATHSHFAIGMSGKFVRLYHNTTCQEYAVFDHGETVQQVEFSFKGNMLASSGSRKICLWDVNAKTLLWNMEPATTCLAMTFNGDPDELVIACNNNTLYYLDIEHGQLQEEIPWFMDADHAAEIGQSPTTAAFSSQHQLLAFVYRGRHIGLWNWKTDSFIGLCIKPGATSQVCPFHATSLVFSPVPNSNSLAASYEQGEILVFDPITGFVKANYRANTDNQTLACSPDGRTLLAGDASGAIRIFDFQSLDSDGSKLKLLHIITSAEAPVKALAFLNDKRFVDLRGREIKVWEPIAVVRSESSHSDTESVASEEISTSNSLAPSGLLRGQATDRITALAIHPIRKHVFCGTEGGVIRVFDTSNGRQLQTITGFPPGDTTLLIAFNPSGDIIASAGISTRFLLHELVFRGKWTVNEMLFEHRMAETIEQILFNLDGTKVLVVTTALDLIYSIQDGRKASVSWETRLPGMWCNNPKNHQQLLLWVNKTVRIYDWDTLAQITSVPSIILDFDLPARYGIRNIFCGFSNTVVATVFSEAAHARAATCLHFWDANELVEGAKVPDSTTRPCSYHQPFGLEISGLVGTLGMIIDISEDRVLFMDQDGWVCSMFFDNNDSKACQRHFFLPMDWISTSNALIVALIGNKEMIFAKGGEVAVIKRGLSSG